MIRSPFSGRPTIVDPVVTFFILSRYRRYAERQVSTPARTSELRKLALLDRKQPPITRVIQNMLATMRWFLALLFAKKTRSPMCKNYGHVIDHTTWKRGYPNCSECGVQVTDPTALRRASIEEKPLSCIRK